MDQNGADGSGAAPSGTALLASLSHSGDWHRDRLQGVGGSDAKIIMSGEWQKLWEIKTGRRRDDNLSDVLPVCLGSFTEAFNAAWFEKQTGIAIRRTDCTGLVHPTHKHMRCNLDGVCAGGIFEAKHVGGFNKAEDIVARYYPQLQHNMIVTGIGNAYLSVIFGNHKWEYFEIGADEDYQADLLQQEVEFWRCVLMDEEPADRDAALPPVTFDEMREVDMTGNNEWASAAADWLENRLAAKQFEDARQGLKTLTEADVKRAFGHGIETRRAKNGAIRIGEDK